MQRYLLTLSLAAWLCLGCAQAPEIAKQASEKIIVVSGSIEQAEPVVSALEAATGKSIPIEVVTKGEEVAGRIETIAQTGARVASIVSVAPGPQQPFVAGAAAVLGAVGTLAGAIGAFFQRRKAARIAKAAVAAAHETPGGGSAIVSASELLGVDGAIRAAYAAAIAKAEIDPAASASDDAD